MMTIDRLFGEWKDVQARYDAAREATDILRLKQGEIERRRQLVERIGRDRCAAEGRWTYQVIEGEGRSHGCQWVTRRPIED